MSGLSLNEIPDIPGCKAKGHGLAAIVEAPWHKLGLMAPET